MAADDYIWPISYASGIEEKARTNSVKFGDAYEQVSPDGINVLEVSATIVHEHVNDTDLSAILTLLRARKGVSYFYYTLPVAGYNTQRKFRCDSWKADPLQYNDSRFSADFREVFEV